MFKAIVSILFAPVLLAILVGSIAMASDAPVSPTESNLVERETTVVNEDPEAEQENSPAPTSTPVDTPATERTERNEILKTIHDTRDERQQMLSARAQERITNLAANLSNRLEAVMARLDNIAYRLESRLNKMSAEGVEVSEASLALENARANISLAQRELQGIDALVAGAVTSASPREAWNNVKRVYVNTKEAVRRAHASLRESVILAKTALIESRNPEESETNPVEPS